MKAWGSPWYNGAMKKRTNISAPLADRIILLAERHGHEVTVGPRHNPTAALEASVPVRSLLGRFLTKVGFVNRQLGADHRTCYTTIDVSLQKRGGVPTLRVFAVSVA